MEQPIVLHADGVAHSYPQRQVLGPCSFSLRQGEVVAVVGRSGVGKTTLLRLLSGLMRPSAGQVLVGSRPVSASRGDIAVVFQNYALFPWYTAQQNVEYPLKVAGVGRRERAERARAALAQVGLHDATHLYPDQLSGGMQQRVAIARAIVVRPAVMLLDEPMSALDRVTRCALQDQFRTLFEELGCAAVVVTHDLAEAVRLARRVLVLAGSPGAVVADCTFSGGDPRQHIEALQDLMAAQSGPALVAPLPAAGTQRFA